MDKDIKEAAKQLKSEIKAGFAENKDNLKEVKGELRKMRHELKDKVSEIDVQELAAKKDALLMEGEIKKEKVEADLRKLKEDAELRAQVMRETAETKKNA